MKRSASARPVLAVEERGADIGRSRRGAAVGGAGFNESDTALVKVFANAAMVALTIGEARVELEQLQATADRERIGRDLHDTVIQQLFALGMACKVSSD